MAPITTFRDDAEAIALANGTEYGLKAAVHSRSFDHALEVGRHLQAGGIHIQRANGRRRGRGPIPGDQGFGPRRGGWTGQHRGIHPLTMDHQRREPNPTQSVGSESPNRKAPRSTANSSAADGWGRSKRCYERWICRCQAGVVNTAAAMNPFPTASLGGAAGCLLTVVVLRTSDIAVVPGQRPSSVKVKGGGVLGIWDRHRSCRAHGAAVLGRLVPVRRIRPRRFRARPIRRLCGLWARGGGSKARQSRSVMLA